MKRAMLAINVEDAGTYYTTAPNARVQGDGGWRARSLGPLALAV